MAHDVTNRCIIVNKFCLENKIRDEKEIDLFFLSRDGGVLIKCYHVYRKWVWKGESHDSSYTARSEEMDALGTTF